VGQHGTMGGFRNTESHLDKEKITRLWELWNNNNLEFTKTLAIYLNSYKDL
jgi:hypothetical protein